MKTRFLIAATIMLPVSVEAEPLSFNAALERAATDAPSLRARTASVSAAQSAAIASDRLPDPTLDVGIRDFPVTGPDAGRFNRDDFTATSIGIRQQFINPAKRRARAARAGAEIGIAEADVRLEARSVRLQTALAWIDLYYSEKRLIILKMLEAGLDDLQSTVAARLTSGSARPSAALEPDQMRAQVADRRSELVAAAAKARASLMRFTGDPNPIVSGLPPTPKVDRVQLAANIPQLPTLRAYDAQSIAADADTRLASADKRPDWAISASYGRREPNFGDLVSVGVSIDLPFFAKRRQNPRISARAFEADRVRFDRQAAEREMIAALDGDLAEHDAHHARLDNARTVLVPLARRRAELDRESYSVGAVDLGAALLSSLALAEAEIDELAREAEVARDAIRITITYGEDGE